MSKTGSKKKVVVTTANKVSPTVSKKKSRVSTAPSTRGGKELIFGKTNYLWMLAGIGLIGLGFILMSGGAMPSTDVWDESIIYSTRRIVIAPLVIICGLVLEIYAIFKKPTPNKPENAL